MKKTKAPIHRGELVERYGKDRVRAIKNTGLNMKVNIFGVYLGNQKKDKVEIAQNLIVDTGPVEL